MKKSAVILAVFLLCSILPYTFGQADAQASGVIAGKVTSLAGTGIEKVWVRVYSLSNLSKGQAQTDASGNFRVQYLATDQYRVRFETYSAGNYLPEWYNDKSSFVTADNVAVTDGATTSGIDAQLAVGGVIAGTVTNVSSAGIQNVYAYAYDSAGTFVNSGSTDASGNYTIQGLPGGNYRLQFGTYIAGNYFPEWYNDKSSLETADNIAVTPGSTTSGINAVLATAAVISGTVTNAAGAGTPSVFVTAYDLSGLPVKDGMTDAFGNYKIEGLPTGTYRVFFEASYNTNDLSEWYNDKSSFDTADNISVTAGGAAVINAQFAAGGIISGTVTAPSGSGVPYVIVKVYDLKQGYLKSQPTNSSGVYQVQGLPTGIYKVFFQTSSASGNFAPEWYNDKSIFSAADPVSLTAGATMPGIDAQLAAGGTIFGQITTPSGVGIQGAKAQAYDLNDNYVGFATSDINGRYGIQKLPSGIFKVYFAGPSGGGFIPEWYNNKSGFSSATEVAVLAPNWTMDIDAQLARGGTLSGTVTSAAAGAGIQYVGVRILDLNGAGIRYGSTDILGAYSVDAVPPGQYKVLFEPPPYLLFSDMNFAPRFFNGAAKFADAAIVTVSSGVTISNINAQLGAGGRITGTVTAAASGASAQAAGLESVQVWATDKDGLFNAQAVTAADGTYALTGLASTDYYVRFDKPPYVSQFYNGKYGQATADLVAASAGGTVTGVNATLVKGGTISGTVRNVSGQGVANVVIRIYDIQGLATDLGAVSDGTGQYSVALPAGSWKVLFNAQWTDDNCASQWYSAKYGFQQADAVTVTAGSAMTGIDAVLGSGGTMRGRVTNAGRAGIGGVKVILKDGDNREFLTTTTAADGFYALKGVPAGSYKVYFETAGVTAGLYSSLWYKNRSSFAAADSVAVASGSTTNGIDAVLAPVSGADLLLSRVQLYFAGTTAGAVSGPQSFFVSAYGSGTLSWTASGDAGWLSCAPNAGSGNGAVVASVNPAGLPIGGYAAKITVSSPTAWNSPQTVDVNLVIGNPGTGSGVFPFGDFATPIDGTTGITGAIPITGWVLDDIEVTKVEIWRDAFAGEIAGLWKIGDAIFVEGARPDIELIFPEYPMNYRAGWGYMLLTNMLPAQGNGTYKLYAYATDKEGNRALLGTKTITCSNATAVKPFGTIDSPPQGGDASGNSFWNFGWVLTPLTKTVPKDGSTILVYVDGAYAGNLATAPSVYNQYREDVSTAFPGLNNTGAPGVGGPVGAYLLDTTNYANGVHTIQWVATDDGGAADGIGSRYFNIVNMGTTASISSPANEKVSHREERSNAAITPQLSHCEPLGVAIRLEESSRVFRGISSTFVKIEDMLNLPLSFDPLNVKRGFNPSSPAESITPDNYGSIHIEIREVERIEVDFGKGRDYRGYLVVGNELRSLPIGSTLDQRNGTFSWMPGPGFIGTYDLLFLQTDEFGITRRIPVKVTIKPKFNRH